MADAVVLRSPAPVTARLRSPMPIAHADPDRNSSSDVADRRFVNYARARRSEMLEIPSDLILTAATQRSPPAGRGSGQCGLPTPSDRQAFQDRTAQRDGAARFTLSAQPALTRCGMICAHGLALGFPALRLERRPYGIRGRSAWRSGSIKHIAASIRQPDRDLASRRRISHLTDGGRAP